MASINLLQRQINKIVDYLAEQGKKVIHDAVQTKTTKARTQNQNDAYGWAVYYNGEEMKRGYLTETQQAQTERHGWKSQGIEPGYGRKDVDEFFTDYEPKTDGFQLVVVNAVFYTAILERGGGGVSRKYRVITQEFAKMADAGRGLSKKFTVELLK